jgi:hypothetical protein
MLDSEQMTFNIPICNNLRVHLPGFFANGHGSNCLFMPRVVAIHAWFVMMAAAFTRHRSHAKK